MENDLFRIFTGDWSVQNGDIVYIVMRTYQQIQDIVG